MGLSAGRLRHRIAIERQVQSRGADGSVLVSWETFCETWAEIKPMSVNALIAAQAAQSKASVMVVIRYREGIDATMRVRHISKNAIYALVADPLEDQVSGRDSMTLACSRGLSDGR